MREVKDSMYGGAVGCQAIRELGVDQDTKVAVPG